MRFVLLETLEFLETLEKGLWRVSTGDCRDCVDYRHYRDCRSYVTVMSVQTENLQKKILVNKLLFLIGSLKGRNASTSKKY